MTDRSAFVPAVRPASNAPSRTRVALAVAAALGGPAFAGPVGPTVVNGAIQVSQPDARTTVVKQSTDKGIVDWQGFSVAAGERVQFQQPNAASVTLNRVTSAATPSEIYGSLSATGKVFLVNPAGIVFGKDAAVDVGGLVASTLAIRNDDFLAGRFAFSDDGHAGAVRNGGRITAADGGTVALLGAQVGNDGTIGARLGTVGLAAGTKVTLDFGADGLSRIVVDAARVNALVENGGAILSEGGQVTLTARALGSLADTVVNNTGVVSATSLVERNGRILLDGGDTGTVRVGGTLDAGGLAAGRRGGAVSIQGHDIVLADGGAIDVRGDAGGGSVAVGKDDGASATATPHAATTTMAAGHAIRADATDAGDGGSILLWSDGKTSVAGTLSARGGAAAGDGGFIETSGKQVDVAGLRADASAAHGKAGTWLLDPDDVTVNQDAADAYMVALNGGTNATVSSNGNLTVDSNVHIVKDRGGDATLTFNAARDIVVKPGFTVDATVGKLNVVMNADSGGASSAGSGSGFGVGAISIDGTADATHMQARILTNGGDLLLYGQSDPLRGAAIGHPGQETGVNLIKTRFDTRVTDPTGTQSDGRILISGTGDDTTGGTGVKLDSVGMSSGAGAIQITGQGGASYRGGVGVQIGNATANTIATSSGTISIHGTDGSARFVSLHGPNTEQVGAPGIEATLSLFDITSASGDIALVGQSYRPGSSTAGFDLNMYGGSISTGGRLTLIGFADLEAYAGLSVQGTGSGGNRSDLTAGAGGMRLIGHNGGGIGLAMQQSVATTTGGGQLALAGDSSTASGILLYRTQLGRIDMSGDISVRAYSSAGNVAMLAPQDMVGDTAYTTSGTVAFFPGSGDIAGNLLTRVDVPITVGTQASAAPGSFVVSFDELGLARAFPARVVVGNQNQRAAISFNDPAPFYGSLTLQNDAAGSAGIALNTNVNVSGQLTLSSGGTVAAANLDGPVAGITANALLLHGSTGASNFQLASTNNHVGTLAAVFDQSKAGGSASAGDVNFTNADALAFGSLTGSVYSAANNATSTVGAPNSVVAGDLFVRTSGNLTLGQSVLTLAGDLTLVTGGVLKNPANGALTAGGGNWRLFADTWVGETRGGLAGSTPHPNLYGCAYDSGCWNGTAGNHFFYRAQPTVTVTPDNVSRPYGSANAPLTFTANLINGDTAADALSGSLATTAQTASPVGSYAITGSYTSPVGYIVNVRQGTLQVTAAPLQVIVDNKTKVYGDADPALSAGYSGFKLGDTAAVVTGLTFATTTGQAATAGTHPITASGASAPNYAITYQPGTLTVAKAPLAVNIDNKAKTYGDADPALSASYAGLRYADTAAVVGGLTLSTTTGKNATAGTHPITGANASAANYSLTYNPGTLTVAPAPLTVLVDDQRKQYGDADPALTYRATGLKYDDTLATAGGVTLSTATGAAATAGTHPIIARTGASSNYVVTSQPGLLTVDKAPLVVSADDKAKVYGDPDPAYSASASGLKYADTAAVVSGLSFGAPAGAAATAGTHPITVAGGSAANYMLVGYQGGTLTVAKAPLTITADDKRKVYGDTDPALTASYGGLKYADTAAAVSGLTLTTTTGAAATAGPHPITAAGAGAANYAIGYVPGTLNVDQAVLTYVATPTSQFQETTAPTLGGTVTGFAYGDTLASATTGQLAFGTATTLQSPLGAYAVSGSGLQAANYRFVQAPSNATALTVYASPVQVVPNIEKDVTFESSNVYEKNFGTPHLCVAVGPLDAGVSAGEGYDPLALEWSRVRVSPNLSNCLGLGQRNGCADF